MAEKLCLQWNDFKENVIGSLGNLKDDKDFLDVTLASEDGKQVEAHKVVLVMSSPFFQNLLKRNKHPHPLIYMRGVRSEDLLAIVDFLYHGEVYLCQKYLDSFLALAEELQLKGMMGNPSSDEPIQTESETPYIKKESRIQSHSSSSPKPPSLLGNESEDDILNIDRGNRSVARASYFSGNVQELDEKCVSMMEKTFKQDKDGKLLYSCTICGKQAINSALKNHIEANHLEGVSIPCNFCETICSTRNALKLHVTRNHLEGISIPCNFCKMIFRTKNALRLHMTKNHKESSLH